MHRIGAKGSYKCQVLEVSGQKNGNYLEAPKLGHCSSCFLTLIPMQLPLKYVHYVLLFHFCMYM